METARCNSRPCCAPYNFTTVDTYPRTRHARPRALGLTQCLGLELVRLPILLLYHPTQHGHFRPQSLGVGPILLLAAYTMDKANDPAYVASHRVMRRIFPPKMQTLSLPSQYLLDVKHPDGSALSTEELSKLVREMQPRCGRDAAGMQPGCGRDAVEMQPGCSRDTGAMHHQVTSASTRSGGRLVARVACRS